MSARNFKIHGKRKRFGNVTIEREGIYTRVRLYDTVVVKFNKIFQSVELNTGDWFTNTTKTAINHALKQIKGFKTVRVYSHKGQWKVFINGQAKYNFKDGMVLGVGYRTVHLIYLPVLSV